MPTHIGEYIRDRRKTLNLTQQAIANHIQIQKAHISDIELGRRSPAPSRLADLATVLDCSEDYLWYLLGLWPPQCLGLPENEFREALERFRCAAKS